MKRKRVLIRSGSWDDLDTRNHRCAYHYRDNPYRFDLIGFRIVSPSFFVINKEMVGK
jgi:hypothetical protein